MQPSKSLIFLIFLALFTLPLTGHPALKKVKALMQEANYKLALQKIDATNLDKSISLETKTRLLWEKATCLISLGHPAQSQTVFYKLLSLSPDFQATQLSSPKILQIFKKAGHGLKEHNKQHLSRYFTPKAHLVFANNLNSAIPISLKLDKNQYSNQVQKIIFRYKVLGSNFYSGFEIPIKKEGVFSGVLKDYSVIRSNEPSDIEYYFEFRSKTKIIYELASSQNPLRVLRTQVQTPSKIIYTQPIKSDPNWQYWVAGSLVALGVAGLATAITVSQSSNKSTLNIEITAPRSGGRS